MSITPQEALQRTIEHREIFHDEMLHLMRLIMQGELSPVMTAAIVTGLRVKKETIGEITAAAAEQSDGIGQINAAVNQLDQMTQQNAALVEQSAAAAQSLRDQAERLAGAVQVFKLESGAKPAALQIARTAAIAGPG